MPSTLGPPGPWGREGQWLLRTHGPTFSAEPPTAGVVSTGGLGQMVQGAAVGEVSTPHLMLGFGLSPGQREGPGPRGPGGWELHPSQPCLSPACPAGLHGENCQHACLCRNGGTCDPISGHCTCPEGWAGLACEKGEHWEGRGGMGDHAGPWEPGLEPRWAPGSPSLCGKASSLLAVGTASWV